MKFVINGQKKLTGTVRVLGAKNAILPIIAATVLTENECVISNVPHISDVETMLQILRSMGGSARWSSEHELTICNRALACKPLDQKLVKRLRASVLFLGPFLVRFTSFTLGEPGGCIIGNRPLDTHLDGLAKLGCVWKHNDAFLSVTHTGLVGADVVLREASVTATENIIMAACGARGITKIKNAACEPHVQDLCAFLISMGAAIEGAGTSEITITGGKSLSGTTHAVISDPIDAGTYIMLGLATKSKISVTRMRPDHLDTVLETLRSMGARFDITKDSVTITNTGLLQATKIETRIYPGIPTDLQPLFGVLATQTQGTTLINETLFESRLGYLQELEKMGASVVISDAHRALITGPTPLYGRSIDCKDLRAGAALVVAGLVASGQTVIDHAEILDRGYEHIDHALLTLGADIRRIE
ncbi:UDP-N-acetylglucosamine 1-carboxyvinyltransferase [Candidatus Uhrbacteria bacterium]|nr:UDP-N-acetylglucosamine 1-carboxyvinyltransferase [Candidatus Uhrbacteria bacterium]